MRAAVALLAGCAPSVVPDGYGGGGLGSLDGPEREAIVATVADDYSIGALASVLLGDWRVLDAVLPTSGDPAVRVDDGRVIQLNRLYTDSVRLLGDDLARPDLEFSVGARTNPHDARVCGGDLFVTLYGTDRVGIFDPSTGDEVGRLSLADHADGDGVGPEPSTLVEVDGALFVGLERLDREAGWTDAGGRVVIVDCAAREEVAWWPVGGNTALAPWPGRSGALALARPFADQPGGIWHVEHDAAPSLLVASGDLAVTAVVASEDRAVAVVVGADQSYRVACADLAAGTLDVVEEVDGWVPTAVGNGAGEAWLAVRPHWRDPEGLGGLDVWDVSRCERRGERIVTELPPFDVAFR
jgi:hypothetical protein